MDRATSTRVCGTSTPKQHPVPTDSNVMPAAARLERVLNIAYLNKAAVDRGEVLPDRGQQRHQLQRGERLNHTAVRGGRGASLSAGLHAPMSAFPAPFGPSRFRRRRPFWRKLGAFARPGYLVAVGYSPGNWATDLAGGYTLLSVSSCCRT